MLHKGSKGAIAALVLTIGFSGPLYAIEDVTDVRDEITCLALNIYFEARSEPTDGKLAVGHVVMNRAADSRYPQKVCDVVKQGGEKPRNKCQFSWFCDGLSDQPRNLQAWKESMVLARVVYWGYSQDPTNGALWYHADYVSPYWRRSLQEGPKIGRHVFYGTVDEVLREKDGESAALDSVRDDEPLSSEVTEIFWPVEIALRKANRT